MLHTVCFIWRQLWEQKKTANPIFVSKLWKKVGGRPNLILSVHLLFLFLPWAFSFGTFPLWITAALETHENPLWIYDTRLKSMKMSCFRFIKVTNLSTHRACLHYLGCQAWSVLSPRPNINIYALVSIYVDDYFGPRSRTCCKCQLRMWQNACDH